MRRWLQWALTQQPALFEQAFGRMFSTRPPVSSDPPEAAALQRFWQPQAGGSIARVSASAESLSRYQTDFQVDTRVSISPNAARDAVPLESCCHRWEL